MKSLYLLLLLLGTIFLGGCASSHDSASTAFPAANANPWEYKTVSLHAYSMGLIQTQLDELGRQGWQPVDPHLSVRRTSSDYVLVVTLKRPR